MCGQDCTLVHLQYCGQESVTLIIASAHSSIRSNSNLTCPTSELSRDLRMSVLEGKKEAQGSQFAQGQSASEAMPPAAVVTPSFMSDTWTFKGRHTSPLTPLLSKAPTPPLYPATSNHMPSELHHPLPTISWSYSCTPHRKHKCQVSVACAVSTEGGKPGSPTARCAGVLDIRFNSTDPQQQPTAAEHTFTLHRVAVSIYDSEVIPVSPVTDKPLSGHFTMKWVP